MVMNSHLVQMRRVKRTIYARRRRQQDIWFEQKHYIPINLYFPNVFVIFVAIRLGRNACLYSFRAVICQLFSAECRAFCFSLISFRTCACESVRVCLCNQCFLLALVDTECGQFASFVSKKARVWTL